MSVKRARNERIVLLSPKGQRRLKEAYARRPRRSRTTVQARARRMAMYVRGEAAAYRPWLGRW